MKLLVQPGEGVKPLVKAIRGAKKRVEILIFRFDRKEVEKALIEAVERGVFVHALIAYTNHGGEKSLRELEMRLLGAGVTVARTADDLVRYHGKMMIIDREELHLYGFNYTHLDIEHSRSFGLISKNRTLVQEAVKLFEADTKRQVYTPTAKNFLVSPINARQQLAEFIQGAKQELLIYDPKISDSEMAHLLEAQLEAGIEIKIIGRLMRDRTSLTSRILSKMRLHTRTIVRDRQWVFTGSQSLRTAELDTRREIGIIFREPKVAATIAKTFDTDWEDAEEDRARTPRKVDEDSVTAKVAKKAAKAVAKELPPVGPLVEAVMKATAGDHSELEWNSDELEDTVKDAVKDAVRQAVQDVVQNRVEQSGK